MSEPLLRDLFRESLTRVYDTKTLADGIRAAIDEAKRLVADGHTEPHVSENVGLRAYASEAGGCERAIALRLVNLKPLEVDDRLAAIFLAGDLLHGSMQEALSQLYPGFTAEHPWCKDGISGRADGIYTVDGVTHIVEIKSISRSGFSLALWKGPKVNHILQAALSAHYFGVTQMHIIYIAKEPVKKPKNLAGRDDIPDQLSMYEWHLDLDPYQAEQEWNRLAGITFRTSVGEIGDRETPFEWIEDPNQVKFPCSYCDAKPLCLRLGPDRQPLARVLDFVPGHVLPPLTIAPDRAAPPLPV